MKVFVGMIIDTPDYGETEFRQAMDKLIKDIDKNSDLLELEMFKVERNLILDRMRLKRTWEV